METSSDVLSGKSVPWPGTVDTNIWWKILSQYTNHIVILSDCDGRFLFANEEAKKFLSRSNEDLVGRTWQDVLPPKVANELSMYARTVHKTNKPIELIGMVKGICLRTLFLPIRTVENSMPMLLVICNQLTALDQQSRLEDNNGVQKVVAEFNDLGPLSILSERELEILAYIGEGWSPPEIAKRLHRSVKTIDWHRRSLGRKLGANNTLQLVRIAINAGLNHVGLLDKRFRFDFTTYTAVAARD